MILNSCQEWIRATSRRNEKKKRRPRRERRAREKPDEPVNARLNTPTDVSLEHNSIAPNSRCGALLGCPRRARSASDRVCLPASRPLLCCRREGDLGGVPRRGKIRRVLCTSLGRRFPLRFRPGQPAGISLPRGLLDLQASAGERPFPCRCGKLRDTSHSARGAPTCRVHASKVIRRGAPSPSRPSGSFLRALKRERARLRFRRTIRPAKKQPQASGVRLRRPTACVANSLSFSPTR